MFQLQIYYEIRKKQPKFVVRKTLLTAILANFVNTLSNNYQYQSRQHPVLLNDLYILSWIELHIAHFVGYNNYEYPFTL